MIVTMIEASGETHVKDIPLPEAWDASSVQAFISKLIVPGISIADACRGLLLVVEKLAMKGLD